MEAVKLENIFVQVTPTPEHIEDKQVEEESSPKDLAESKNQKWTERDHALYVLFLEENRDIIKSKLIRRYFFAYLGQITSIRKWEYSSAIKQGFSAEVTTRNTKPNTSSPTRSSRRKNKKWTHFTMQLSKIASKLPQTKPQPTSPPIPTSLKLAPQTVKERFPAKQTIKA